MSMQIREIRAAIRGFDETLWKHGMRGLQRAKLRDLQINVGKLCNQACHHCHVDAGPKRPEIMQWETMQRIIDWAANSDVASVDVTGGAPELNPNFRRMVDALLALGIAITARCNLSVLFEPHQDDLAQWYAERRIRLVCSLPCYTQENVDKQRGKGVFDKSITALQLLNRHGYGRNRELPLDLVYNPGGAFLPPAQAKLEHDYKRRLKDEFDIDFSALLTMTNLPISRFRHYLERTGQETAYRELLAAAFNPTTIDGLMCRHLISVDWLGRVYDCDFNQMLEMPLGGTQQRYLWEIDAAQLPRGRIAIGDHCFGCTAGAGSSCGGALA